MKENLNKALKAAWLLDGEGSGSKLEPSVMRAWKPEDGLLWVHLNLDAPETPVWLREEAALPASFVDLMLAEKTRLRLHIDDENLMLILRAVNLNPGADPDEMVQLRIFTDGKRIISMSRQKVYAVKDLNERFKKSQGPKDLPVLISRLCERIVSRIGQVVDQLQENVDEMEEAVLTGDTSNLRDSLADMRHQGIALKRFILPQRDALMELIEDPPDWLDETSVILLDQVAERTNRLAEDLNTIRERAGVIQDELTNRLDERLNRIMYVLAITAAIFLPLGFITGLVGVNLGGMPGTENPDAFYILCGVLVLIVVIQIWLFKRWKWF